MSSGNGYVPFFLVKKVIAAVRKFLEAVLWIAGTGAPWRDLPEGFGNWNSGLIHVKEMGTDQIALEHHFASVHIAEWRAAWPMLGIGVSGARRSDRPYLHAAGDRVRDFSYVPPARFAHLHVKIGSQNPQPTDMVTNGFVLSANRIWNIGLDCRCRCLRRDRPTGSRPSAAGKMRRRSPKSGAGEWKKKLS